jgi:hypothetical protein
VRKDNCNGKGVAPPSCSSSCGRAGRSPPGSHPMLTFVCSCWQGSDAVHAVSVLTLLPALCCVLQM